MSYQHLFDYAFWRKPVSAAPFVVLRFVFGLLMAAGTIRFLGLGWVEDHYTKPLMHFRYFGFSWVPVFSKEILYGIHYLMLFSSLSFAFGWHYRVSAILLFLTFTYTELIDLSYYLNHYYFVSLACLLFCFVPLPVREPSLSKVGALPRWATAMFPFMLAIVYVYAGLAKINSDWLFKALPLKIWLPAHDDLPILGPILAWKQTPYLFSWFGMIYDCSIPFFLLWKKSRPYAYLAVVVFHIITGILFQIGVFPAVMIGATLVFFSPAWHEKILNYLPFIKTSFASVQLKETKEKWILSFLILFFAFQLMFPWRYLFYPGNMFWTEEGYRFGWRVMLMEKAGTAQFYIKDGKTGKEGQVINGDFLNIHQEKQMAMQPDMILQYAHFLGEYYKKKGMANPEVRAEVYVTLNGKPSQLLIDPKIDLMKIEDGWAPKTWILNGEKDH